MYPSSGSGVSLSRILVRLILALVCVGNLAPWYQTPNSGGLSVVEALGDKWCCIRDHILFYCPGDDSCARCSQAAPYKNYLCFDKKCSWYYGCSQGCSACHLHDDHWKSNGGEQEEETEEERK